MTALNGSLKLFSRLEKRPAAGFSVLALTPDQMAEPQRRLASLISSVRCEVIGPIELAQAIAWQLKFNQKMTSQRVLARFLNKHERWVCERLLILTLAEHFLEKLRICEVFVCINSVVRIARLSNTTWQEELVEAVCAGTSNLNIRAMIRAFQGKAKPVKPQEAYQTSRQWVVTLQSDGSAITPEHLLEALEDVTGQVKAAIVGHLPASMPEPPGEPAQVKATRKSPVPFVEAAVEPPKPNKNDLVRRIILQRA